MSSELFWGATALLVAAGYASKDAVAAEIIAHSDSFTRYDPLFKKYGILEGVPFERLKAIAMNESSLGTHKSVARGIENPLDIEGSKSEDGLSWGLMQMTLPTLRDFDPNGDQVKLNNPEYSIKYAAKFIASLQRQFDREERREEWVVKAYNQGAGNTRKEIRGERTPRFADVQEYWARYQRNQALIRRKQGQI